MRVKTLATKIDKIQSNEKRKEVYTAVDNMYEYTKYKLQYYNVPKAVIEELVEYNMSVMLSYANESELIEGYNE